MIPTAIIASVFYTVMVWWVGTGAVLWLDRLPRRTFGWSLIGASAIAALSVYGVLANLANPSPVGAVISFTSAIGIWSWHETGFPHRPDNRSKDVAMPARGRRLATVRFGDLHLDLS